MPGIGTKTAAQLIGEYGDLDTLLARAGEIKQEKRRQALIENAERARLSKKLVTLDEHVPVEVPLADLVVHEPDYKRLVAFLKAMEFATLTRRVAEFSGIDAGEIEADGRLRGWPAAGTEAPAAERTVPSSHTEKQAKAGAPGEHAGAPLPDSYVPVALARARIEGAHHAKIDRSRYEIVRTLDRLTAWVTRAGAVGMLAVDTETTTLDPMQATLCGIALAVAPNEACYVPLAHRQGGDKGSLFPGSLAADQMEEGSALAALKPLLENPGVLKIGQNLKFDLQIFALRGIALSPYDDTMLMSYVLDAGRSDHGLDPLSKRYFDHTTIDYNEVTGSGKSKLAFDCVDVARAAEYAAEDADVTLRLWHVLKPRLASEHVLSVYETLERPLVAVLARMERRGISVDHKALSQLSTEFGHKALALEAEIHKLADGPLNPGSPKQISDFLFGKLGFEGGTKTKTGAWSTGARTLDDLAEQGHELPRKIF